MPIASIVISVSNGVSPDKVDDFVIKKGTYILSALQRFKQIEEFEPRLKQYVSDETFRILGRGVRLNVQQGLKGSVMSDGIYIYLTVKDTSNQTKKGRLIERYLTNECQSIFSEIINEMYPLFQKYGVKMPDIKLRDMKTRWGSCSPSHGVTTLNKNLLEAQGIVSNM